MIDLLSEKSRQAAIPTLEILSEDQYIKNKLGVLNAGGFPFERVGLHPDPFVFILKYTSVHDIASIFLKKHKNIFLLMHNNLIYVLFFVSILQTHFKKFELYITIVR